MASGRSGTRSPWERSKPEGGRKTTLTAASKTKAASRARRAGRGYPNLVDNMRAAVEQRAAKHTKKKSKTGRVSKQRTRGKASGSKAARRRRSR